MGAHFQILLALKERDTTPGGADDVLLAEDGTAFLAEDGDNILLEDGD